MTDAANRLLGLLDGVRKTANGWEARCPAHEDQRASLSVGIGDNGGIVVHCFAGCPTETVLAKIGWSLKDLMPSGNGDGWGEIVKIYEYRGKGGELLFEVCRTHPKDFFQRQPDPNGGWLNHTRGVRKVLYRLPELLAADPTELVFLVEGEKDCNRLRSLGLVASCNSGGAGKWPATYTETLKGRDVIILPDADQPGRDHAQKVAGSLRGKAASCKVVDLPGLREHGDVSDWLQAGGTAEELLRLASEVPEWEPEEPRAVATRGGDYHCTDLGNGKRFADQHRENIRYCHPWSKWLVWDGRRWALDQTAAVERLAEETIKSLWYEAMAESDDRERQAKAKWAARSEEASRIASMLKLARSQEGVPILPDQLDRDRWLLNVANGTLDLKTGHLRDHRREDLITKLCPVEYLSPAESKCPLWDTFLDQVFDRSDHLVSFVRRLFGYCLTGTIRDHVLPIFHGIGSNGKSTLLETIMAMLGPDYSMKAAHDFLMVKRGETHPTDLADLFGKRLVVCVESEDNRRLAESLIKELTGGDTIRARRMREDFWQFQATHKILLGTNHKPVVRGTDHATWRRLRLVPFGVVIPDDEQDKDLPVKLKGELTGILGWAVRGCLEWQQEGLAEPKEVREATTQYRNEEDVIGSFLSECCITDPKERERASTLYGAYKSWSDRNREEAATQQKFGRTLRDRGFQREKAGTYWWLGIALQSNEWE